MPTTVEIPLQPDSPDTTNANAVWVPLRSLPGPNGVYRFSKTGNPGPISGRALWTFKGIVPKNVAPTPAWNLVVHHTDASGDGGAVLLRVEASVYASGDTPTNHTVIVPNQLVGVRASGDVNYTVLSGTNFDSLLALTAGSLLRVQMSRMPLGVSGDSLVSHWDLFQPPILRVDVT